MTGRGKELGGYDPRWRARGVVTSFSGWYEHLIGDPRRGHAIERVISIRFRRMLDLLASCAGFPAKGNLFAIFGEPDIEVEAMDDGNAGMRVVRV